MDAAALDSLARGVAGKPVAEIVSLEDANKVLAALDGKTTAAPAAAAEAAPQPEKEKPARRTKSPGEKLHADLGRLKNAEGIRLSADEQRQLIYCTSRGRTEHASELDESEINTALTLGKDVTEGRTRMEDIRAVNDDHRAAQQAAGSAVADFDAGITSDERVAS
jgi:hypothetical protein